MSEEPVKKVVQFKKEGLQLQCEWAECQSLFNSISALLFHVSEHINSIISESDYICQWSLCGYVANSSMSLTRHVYYHAFHTKIKCLGKNILQRQHLSIKSCRLDTSRRNTIPLFDLDFKCVWEDCEMSFSSVQNFYWHVNDHADSSPKGNKPKNGVVCKWNDCGNSFQSQHKLKDHLRSHTQEKLTACPGCGGLFANRTKLVDHIQRQANAADSESHVCTYCYKEFPSDRLLRNHMRNHVNHYKCPYCDMTCPQPSSLRSHVKYRHCDKKPYICDHCTFSAKTPNDLQKHASTHGGGSMFKCMAAGCSYKASRLKTVKHHINTRHQSRDSSPKYVCHICEKVFIRGAFLTKHLMKAHDYHWPSGHSRFRYTKTKDGTFRLQTVRYESIELTQDIIDDTESETEMTSEAPSDASATQQQQSNTEVYLSIPENVASYEVQSSSTLKNDPETFCSP